MENTCRRRLSLRQVPRKIEHDEWRWRAEHTFWFLLHHMARRSHSEHQTNRREKADELVQESEELSLMCGDANPDSPVEPRLEWKSIRLTQLQI